MTRQDARNAIYDAINMPGLLSPAASDFYFGLADRICLGRTSRRDAVSSALYSFMFGGKAAGLREIPGSMRKGCWEKCAGTDACGGCRFRRPENKTEGCG